MENKDCVFCKMFENRDENVIDIEPLNPVTEGHRIVIPRKHVTDFTEDHGTTMNVMGYASLLAKELGGDFNLITSKGEHATQTVFHLHVHLVPRKDKDGLKLPWTDQKKIQHKPRVGIEH